MHPLRRQAMHGVFLGVVDLAMHQMVKVKLRRRLEEDAAGHLAVAANAVWGAHRPSGVARRQIKIIDMIVGVAHPLLHVFGINQLIGSSAKWRAETLR